ncbi:MAG: YheC/YheD family protein [Firmicutes bacterium]|nr:YheC/YheD family protein [Bacillota bacterium]
MSYDIASDKTEKQTQLGVLIRNQHIRNMLKQKPATRFQRLQDANTEDGITLFFFSLINVDFEPQVIKAVFFDKLDHLWKEGNFAFPDVLYFCGGIPKRLRPLYQQFISALKVKQCKFLNHIKGFDKWEICQLLAQNADIRHYLPETRLFSGGNSLRDMLHIHGTVYLKGCYGQRGEQVIRVKKISATMYEYRFFINRLRIGKVTFKRLIKLLSSFYQHNTFIIQQAISLPDKGGQKMDMRAELQRNGNGEIVIPGICVRLGLVGSPITIHSRSYRLADYVTSTDVNINHLSERKITNFLFGIYSAMEAVYGPLGELGIDFALDTKGKLWFIECNSHPTKVSLMKAYDEGTINQAFCNTLAYAQFLAGSKRESDCDNLSEQARLP